MKSFDDGIPEESMPPYQDLVVLLRQTPSDATSVISEEQAQMLARVRARLHQAEADDGSPEDEPLVPENLDSAFQPLPLRRNAPRRFSRIRRTLNMIAAVLVIGVITGASLFLFSSHQSSNSGVSIPTGAPIGSIKVPVTVRSEAGGLEASLQVTSGPYFLSELLDVTITLTNHSNKSIFLQGGAGTLNFCMGEALILTTTGGGKPYYNLPSNNTPIPSMNCPFTQTELAPGKPLIMQGYISLTKSGLVVLTPEAKFLTFTKDRYGNKSATTSADPLHQHWPVMHINVVAKLPSDRILLLRQQGSQIIINAPTPARSHLVDYEAISCVENGSNVGSRSLGWDSLFTTTLSEPECWGPNKHWTYVVGAPGYAIASGEISS